MKLFGNSCNWYNTFWDMLVTNRQGNSFEWKVRNSQEKLGQGLSTISRDLGPVWSWPCMLVIPRESEWTRLIVALIIFQSHSDWNNVCQAQWLDLWTWLCTEPVFVLVRPAASLYSASSLKHHTMGNAVVSQPRPLSWLQASQSVSNFYVLNDK